MGNCLGKQKKYQDMKEGATSTVALERQPPDHIEVTEFYLPTASDPPIMKMEHIEIKETPQTKTKYNTQNNGIVIPKKPAIRVFMKYDQEKPAIPKKGFRVYHACSLGYVLSQHEASGNLWFSHNLIGFQAQSPSSDQMRQTWKKMKAVLKIHNWKSKRSLHISASKCETVTGKEMRMFILDLGKQFPGVVKKAKFDLTCCSKITNRGLETFGTSISRYLVNLEHLTIKLVSCQGISQKGFNIFGSEVGKHMIRLKYLSLDFSNCDRLVGRAIKNLGSNISRHLVNLKQLQLYFPYCRGLSDVGLDMLASEISRDRLNLEQLTLDFSGYYQLRDKLLKAFEHNIRDIPTLQQFTLILQRCDVTDEGLRSLGIALSSHIKNLQRFSLNVSGSLTFENRSLELTDRGFMSLMSPININLSSLKYIALDFSSCRKISDNGLEMFAKQFTAHLTELEGLKLDFSWCKLSNHGIEEFCLEVAGRLPRLKYINLNLQFCQGITKMCSTKLNGAFSYIPDKNKIINIREEMSMS